MANIATVVTPTNSANGVSRSSSVMLILPRASSTTPLITLPKATPSSSARPSEDSQKMMSHVVRHRAQDHDQQHGHHRQVEAGEQRGIDQRESRKQRAAAQY